MKNKIGVIYARYSSDKQREESIEGQLLVCHNFAKENGIKIVREYIDRAQSGTTTERKEFQKMIIDSNSRSFEYVITYKTDRFARNEHDAVVNEYFLKSNGVELLYATQPFLNTSSGRMVKAIFRIQDEEYSLNLSERTKLGLAMNVEKGLVVSGKFPVGYKIVDKKMVIDQDTVHIPRIIFEMYANGETTAAINDHLVSIGEKGYHINTINNMIKNRKYIGILDYNGKEYIDYHPAAIDIDLFNRANLRREQLSKRKVRSSNKYLLSGFLFDSNGRRYKGNSGTSRTGETHRYYSLGKRYLKKQEMDDAVIQSIMDTISLKSKELANIIYNGAVKKDTAAELVDLRKQIAKVDKSIANIIKAIKSGILNVSLKEELDKLEKKKIYLQNEISTAGMYDLTVEEIQSLVSKIKKRHLAEKDKMSLVNLLVDKIIMFETYGVIYYKIAGQSITFEEINRSAKESNGALDYLEPNQNGLIDTSKYIYLTSTFNLDFISVQT